MSLVNIPFGSHNEESPFKTGDLDLQNCASDGKTLFSFVSAGEDGGLALPAAISVDNIIACYSYNIFLPAERKVTVLLGRDNTTSNKFHFYEYGGSNASGWTLIYTIDPATYSYQSAFNPNFVTFQHKQFSAFVNDTTKKYTLLMIFTNVGVFKYGYIAHSVMATSSSLYTLDCTGWFVFDVGLTKLSSFAYNKDYSLDTKFTIGCIFDNISSPSTNTTISSENMFLNYNCAENANTSALTTNQLNKYIAFCIVFETIDGNLIFPNVSRILEKEVTGTDGGGHNYNELYSGLIMLSQTSDNFKKLVGYISKIHIFARIKANTDKSNSFIYAKELNMMDFNYLYSIDFVNKSPITYGGTTYYFSTSSGYARLKNGATHFWHIINEQTLLTTDLISFLGYNVLPIKSSWDDSVVGIHYLSNTNFPKSCFNQYLYINKSVSSLTYQDVLSNVFINNRNFCVNDFEHLIYFTSFNGFGAANDRLILAANLLKVQSEINPKKLDRYESDLIVYGDDGVDIISFGDNFPITAYAKNVLKNVTIITKLCKVVKNVAFIVTSTGIYINSQNLLTSSFNAFPEKISNQIQTTFDLIVANFITEGATLYTYDAVIEQNSMVYIFYFLVSGQIYIYGYSLQYKTWFKISTGFSTKYVIMCYSDWDNYLYGMQSDGTTTAITNVVFKFNRKIAANADLGADTISASLYINCADFSEQNFAKIISLLLEYEVSNNVTITIAQSVNGSSFSNNVQLTLPSAKTIYKGFLRESGNIGTNAVFKITFSSLQGLKFFIKSFNIDTFRSIVKF